MKSFVDYVGLSQVLLQLDHLDYDNVVGTHRKENAGIDPYARSAMPSWRGELLCYQNHARELIPCVITKL